MILPLLKEMVNLSARDSLRVPFHQESNLTLSIGYFSPIESNFDSGVSAKIDT